MTHQAALLRDRDGQRVALAVLSDEPPGGTAYAVIEGIAQRLLAQPPPPRSGWPVP